MRNLETDPLIWPMFTPRRYPAYEDLADELDALSEGRIICRDGLLFQELTPRDVAALTSHELRMAELLSARCRCGCGGWVATVRTGD